MNPRREPSAVQKTCSQRWWRREWWCGFRSRSPSIVAKGHFVSRECKLLSPRRAAGQPFRKALNSTGPPTFAAEILGLQYRNVKSSVESWNIQSCYCSESQLVPFYTDSLCATSSGLLFPPRWKDFLFLITVPLGYRMVRLAAMSSTKNMCSAVNWPCFKERCSLLLSARRTRFFKRR